MRYVELQTTSHFSFLRGASACEELFNEAYICGIEALAIVDRNSVAGIVRAWEASKVTGVRLIVGCRLDLTDGSALLVYPTDRPAYGRIQREGEVVRVVVYKLFDLSDQLATIGGRYVGFKPTTGRGDEFSHG